VDALTVRKNSMMSTARQFTANPDAVGGADGNPFRFFGPPQSGSSCTRRNIGHNYSHRCNIMRSQVVKTRQLSTFCDAYAGSVR